MNGHNDPAVNRYFRLSVAAARQEKIVRDYATDSDKHMRVLVDQRGELLIDKELAGQELSGWDRAETDHLVQRRIRELGL